MTDYARIIASLSPEKRALLAMRLKKKGNAYNSFPLSFSQQRLWFLDQLEPGSPIYNIPAAIRLSGKLNLTTLIQTINEIVQRHEILRTSFTNINGQPVQIVAPKMTLKVPIIDLQEIPETQQAEIVTQLAVEEAQRSFDLARGPLLRITLVQLKADEQIVFFTMHHIISDGWSLGVLIREIAVLYTAFLKRQKSPLTKLKLQYADYARWQQKWMQGAVMPKQLAYWTKQLSDVPPVLELPTDRPRRLMQSYRGAQQTFIIGAEETRKLHQLSRQTGMTLFMTLLASFQTLLYRYSGQEDICIGTPIANRTRAETENLIGFFINTLVLRTNFAGNPSFKDLLTRVKKMTLEAFAHQDLPFEKLVEVLQPDRDMSHTPLFQVMFVLQNTPTQEMKLPGLTLKQLEIDAGTAEFDLTLSMTEDKNGLRGALQYRTELFEDSTIQRLLNHFQQIINEVIENPARPITEIALLSSTEKQHVLNEWNVTDVEFPVDQCLHQLFEAQVAQNPEALAVVAENARITYRELNQRANQLAHYLRKRQVGPDVLVGLSVERSVEMIVGLLGIIKAGGAYLPLDPNYPPERLTFMLQDSDASLVLTQQSLVESFQEKGVTQICLDSQWDEIAGESQECPPVNVCSQNLAYVIYTSGSTGTPKGVLITHQSVVNHNCAIAQKIDLQASDRILQFASINFDAAVEEIFPALLSGATIVLRPGNGVLISGSELLQFIKTENLTILDLPTAYWHAWVNELTMLKEPIPESLRLVIVGGDKALPEHYATWKRIVGDKVAWLNTYGPTETTVISTAFAPENGEYRVEDGLDLPIGRPIANTQIYILDRNLNPTPIGVPGELYIGGIGLARGYLARADLTAQRFVPDCFSNKPGARLYKTGDRVRYLLDGNIEFVGRVDYQVKIRGFRVEPGEIETVLAKHPAIQDVFVMARSDGAQEKRLVAYCIPEPETASDIAEWRNYLSQHLPEYMMPAAFVILDKFPMTPNGKINRRELPLPDYAQVEAGRTYVAPRTPTEEMIADIWADVLNIKQVGVNDNFFELGGHSLLATQLSSRLRDSFKIEVPLRVIFETPTVAGLARYLSAQQMAEKGLQAPPMQRIPRTEYMPVSFAQQRLWFLDQLEPDSPLYNIPDAVRLSGELNLPILAGCVNEIIRRHEILRTTFKTIDGKPVQAIAAEFKLAVPLIDVQEFPAETRESAVRELLLEQAKRSFNLSQGPLIRVLLFRLAATEHIILVIMHHIISDGWSTGVLIQEVAALYKALSMGQASPLPELPFQYADFAVWQRNWLQGKVLETQLNYWKKQLQNLPARLELPVDFPRPVLQTSRGAHQTFLLTPDLSAAFQTLSREEGVTLFMSLLAAFQLLLSRYSGQADICVGTPIANRNRRETENLIGFFVNTLVLRTDLTGDPTFRQLLTRVKEMTLEAYAHQDVPFEKIVDAVQPERNLSQTPLFQVMFILQNMPQQTLELKGLKLAQMGLDTGISNFDLTLAMGEQEGQLGGALEYNLDLFHETTIVRMLEHFRSLLQVIVTEPDQPISRLSFLSRSEKEQIIQQWNQTEVAFPDKSCVHQLIEARVKQTPAATAIMAETGELTYLELDQRANQLAHYLQKSGVGPNVLVGISVERSPEMIIGLLGILKAGGAYVPLDPGYPLERLKYMIQDSGLALLVTQQHLMNAFPQEGLQVVCLDADWEKIATESTENVTTTVTAHHLAYVIYTSGSTGLPKGVMVAHQSVVNHNTEIIRRFLMSATDRVLQFASINFDAAVEEIFPTLMSGATLVLRSRDGVLASGVDLVNMIEEKGLTVLDLPTAYWHEWVFEMTLMEQPIPPHLRLVIVGGDKASPERLATWQQRVGPGVNWVNTYGPTEGTVIATVFEPNQEKPANGIQHQLPIGRPIANMQTFILDSNLQLVPIGVPGELYLGGVGVAQGYLHRPELTAEKFIPHPFSSKPGERLYKTGDLVRYLPEGNIEFIGRVDYQVKIRGFRVEIGEIEAVLEQHPAVREVAVVARDDANGNKRLVAYCVPSVEDLLDQTPPEQMPVAGATGPVFNEPATSVQEQDELKTSGEETGQSLSQQQLVAELRQFVKSKLPEYMVPAAFVLFDRLPRTPSGKIDRKILPEPEPDQVEGGSAPVAPRTPVEEKLAEIWKIVLGLKNVSIHDNFFELGGDSILSIQVIARANQAGLKLMPKQLFEYPTIAGLATVVGTGPTLSAEQGLVTGEVPLTPIQHWFFAQDLPARHHWNQSVMFEISDLSNIDALRQAVQLLLEQHDALRLRYERLNSGWRQYYSENIDIDRSFTLVDLSDLPITERRTAIETTAAKIQASLNLENGPLMRVVFFNLGENVAGRLLITIHHLAVDGVSWRILLEDLQTLYQQLSQGMPAQLPPKTTSYKTWTEKLIQSARTAAIQSTVDFWREMTSKSVVQLPVDFPDGDNSEASAATVKVALNDQETQALLHEVPAVYRTQINDVLLTALVQAFARFTGSRQLLLELEGHGREDLFEAVDLSRTVGWFTSLFPVVLDLRNIHSTGDALKAIKEQYRRIPQRGISYGILGYLSENTDVVKQLSTSLSPEISFNYLGQFDQTVPPTTAFKPAREFQGPDHDLNGKRNYLIEVNGSVADGRLQMEWTYSQNVHRHFTIEKLAQEFIEALRSIIAHCKASDAGGVTPSDFPLARLDQKNLNKVLNKFKERKRV